jgi:hypothetical protein
MKVVSTEQAPTPIGACPQITMLPFVLADRISHR